MKSIRELYQADPGRVLDRLVDGELSEAERRDVLVLLDECSPEWRRLALAFLENQSWTNVMPAVAKELVTPQVSSSAWYRFSSPIWGWALAASLLVATGIAGGTGNRLPWMRGATSTQPVTGASAGLVSRQSASPDSEVALSELPASVIAELRDAGIEVNAKPQFMPFESADGGTAYVPVQNFELNYVGRRGL